MKGSEIGSAEAVEGVVARLLHEPAPRARRSPVGARQKPGPASTELPRRSRILSEPHDRPTLVDWSERIASLELDNEELRHRLENFVPLVLSVIRMTAESSATVTSFRDALEGRLRAIANASSSSPKSGQGSSLDEIIRLELAPYCRANQYELNGPALRLPIEAAQSISMIVHELTTNAVKHGALSCRAGRVSVRWRIKSIGATGTKLCLIWLERNGPGAKETCRRGFGTKILCDDGVAITGGRSTLLIRQEGLKYMLTTPLGSPFA